MYSKGGCEMKRFFVISVVCVVTFVMAWPYASQVSQEHWDFQHIFAVPVPWLMSQEERTDLQQVVTRRLLELSAEVAMFKSYTCDDHDRACADTRRLYVFSSQRDLNNARSAAQIFHFDLSVPTCGDGSYPVNGRCFDGSIPPEPQ